MIYLLLGFHLCRPPLPAPQEWRPAPTPTALYEATPIDEVVLMDDDDPDEVPILEADDEPPQPQCWWVATGGAICWINGKPVKIP